MAGHKGLDEFSEILTAAQIAEMLSMNLDYVRKMSRQGKIPAHKMPGGRAFRDLKGEVVEWLRGLPAHETEVEEQASSG